MPNTCFELEGPKLRVKLQYGYWADEPGPLHEFEYEFPHFHLLQPARKPVDETTSLVSGRSHWNLLLHEPTLASQRIISTIPLTKKIDVRFMNSVVKVLGTLPNNKHLAPSRASASGQGERS